MEKHTQQGLKANWNREQALSRAKRKASSAPYGKELENYRKILKKILSGKKNPQVLILGATPELRDLAIKLGASTMAADISWDMLVRMTGIMKFKNSPKNLFVKSDWLKLADVFEPKSFDIVMADVAINNIPADKNPKIIKDISLLLKPKGYFITRHFVYQPEKEKDNVEIIQNKYNEGKLDFVQVGIHFGMYSEYSGQIHDTKNKILPFGKSITLMNSLIKRGKFKFKKNDRAKWENITKHGAGVRHVPLLEKEWLKIVNRYFSVTDRLTAKGKEWTEWQPVWVLRKNI